MRPKAAALMLILGLLPSFLLVSPVQAITCSGYTVTYNGNTYNLSVTPASTGSCPIQYSSSGILHLALSAVVYNVNIMATTCGGISQSSCGLKDIEIQGWAPVYPTGASYDYICGGPSPSPSCTGNSWSGTLDATVQVSSSCDTAPLKFDGPSGQPSTILEAGVGGVCLGAPEFGLSAAGPLLLAALLFPVLVLFKRRSVTRF